MTLNQFYQYLTFVVTVMSAKRIQNPGVITLHPRSLHMLIFFHLVYLRFTAIMAIPDVTEGRGHHMAEHRKTDNHTITSTPNSESSMNLTNTLDCERKATGEHSTYRASGNHKVRTQNPPAVKRWC